jgi:hypothetical protein
MGLGFVFHERVSEARSPTLQAAGGWLLLLLVAFACYVRPSLPGFGHEMGEVAGELYYTDTAAGSDASSLATLGLWFSAVVGIFVLISQRTAKVFRRLPPLRAYSLDIAGSCTGVLAFMAVSALELPAWAWFVAGALLMALASPSGMVRTIGTAPVLLCALLAFQLDQNLLAMPGFGGEKEVHWSPYQRVEYAGAPHRMLYVNGIGHQVIMPPDILARSLYQRPYAYRASRGLPPYRRVLVIGAGSGNDVAAALGNGAERVDAVEIDPVIARIGRAHHPAGPYDDPRVHLAIGDGRAFMTAAKGPYDLVVFALTDSIVKVSAVAQLRLENYLFTTESVARAHALLSDDGDIVLYNNYRTDVILAKNVLLFERGMGRSPEMLFRSGGTAMMVAGRQTGAPAPASRQGVNLDATTDDWPFPYLARRSLPDLYFKAMAGVTGFVALLVLALRSSAGERRAPLTLRLAFLLMGTAFLLLETKGVIQFSLLFGTTWLNSSLVFLAVLALVLLANRLAPALPADRTINVAYVLLIVFALLGVLLRLDTLLAIGNPVLRFLAAAVVVFAPVFFANIMFSVAFRDRSVPEHLFGWNLVGATLGGVIEYTSMAVGYTALAWVVAVCYTLAFVLLRAGLREARS